MKKANTLLILALLFGIIISCGDENNSNDSQDSIDLELSDTGVVFEEETEIIYFVSTPGEIVEVLNEAKLVYKNELVNDFTKSENYIVQNSQALNLGIYSADLAYCAYYDELSCSANLFFAVQELCRKLEVSYLINNIQLTRVKKNLHNPDSIRGLSKEYNKMIYNHFLENNKENILTLISTGGLIESLYLAVNTIDKIDPNSSIAKAIAEQKYSFEVLRDFAYQQKDDPLVAKIIDDVKELDKIFNLVKEDKSGKTNVENNNGKIVIGSKSNLTIKQEQFDSLKKVIKKIRNKYINL